LVSDVIDRFGRIDTLINVAGVNRRKPIAEVEEGDYDFILGVNLKGAFMLSQAVGRHMLERGSGYTLFLTPTEAVLALGKPQRAEDAAADGPEDEKTPNPDPQNPTTVLRMQLLGANASRSRARRSLALMAKATASCTRKAARFSSRRRGDQVVLAGRQNSISYVLSHRSPVRQLL